MYEFAVPKNDQPMTNVLVWREDEGEERAQKIFLAFILYGFNMCKQHE